MLMEVTTIPKYELMTLLTAAMCNNWVPLH